MAGEDDAGERLDTTLAALAGISRSQARRWIDQGRVRLAGASCRASQKVAEGDRIEADPPEVLPSPLEPEAIPLVVLYEDEHLIVIDKPAGLVVHPGHGCRSGTLVNALLGRGTPLAEAGGRQRPGIVHRLDKDTSGLIVVAKNDATHVSLAQQLKDRKVEKTYIALVEGRVTPPEGRIEAPIGRDPKQRQRMAVVENGRDARTTYRVLREIGRRTLVEVWPHTGRTHQIRVHLASIGFPITGDALYGRRGDAPVARQFLHAQKLSFVHPRTGERLEVEAPLAADLEQTLNELEGG